MPIRTWMLIMALGVPTLAHAKTDTKVTKYQCAGVEKKIKHVNSRLRAGYRAQEGEWLKERLRTLKELRHACKKKRYPVD
ncbi:hypothetical protein [Gallaecimonas sp. GXIMD4217]|uniref:hypothetical protein n=1 Tax=Gallaecimonas sp. GXIMD4217 TaxID=3131927 RepID=UPI00311ABA36